MIPTHATLDIYSNYDSWLDCFLAGYPHEIAYVYRGIHNARLRDLRIELGPNNRENTQWFMWFDFRYMGVPPAVRLLWYVNNPYFTVWTGKGHETFINSPAGVVSFILEYLDSRAAQ